MAQLGLVAERRIDDPISVEFMNRDLARSGLTAVDLGAYPIAPIAMGKCGAYVIPYRDPIMWRIRYDRTEDKYKQPKGIRGVWWSPHQTLDEAREQPSIYIIEGEKKAAAFIKKWPHLFAFGIGGAHNALEPTKDGKVLLADIIKVLSPGKIVNAIFDGDILGKYGIQEAATNLAFACAQVKVDVRIWYAPEGKGVDDWLVANPNAKLADLVEIPFDTLHVARKTLYRQLELTLNEDGNPHQNETNISKILGNFWQGRVINDRRLGVIMDGFPVDEETLTEISVKYIHGFHFHHASTAMIRTALHFAMHDLVRDLVQDMVLGLEWDGVPRLDSWGMDHFETVNPKVANEWGRLLMTGLAFRLAKPGIKVDIVPILIGSQGIGKTTFFEELSVFDGYSFYQSLMKFSSDANDENRGEVAKFKVATIVDLGEGVVFNAYKTNIDLMKQRLTQVSDTYRTLYKGYVTTISRGFIFVGTSNRSDLLSDATGSRRFLMLKTTKINKLSYEKKIQILAEVIAKKEELLFTNWYDIRLTKEDLVIEDRNKHITNVQELLNIDFKKEDSFELQILELIENNRLAKYKDSRGYFVSTKYLYQVLSSELRLDADRLTNRMSRLTSSTTFKYRCEKAKPTEKQLEFPSKGVQDVYMAGINNDQRMIVGYQLLPR